MRFHGDQKTGKIAKAIIALTTTTALAACGALGGEPRTSSVLAAPSQNGPQADYPVTIGAPYSIAGTNYTPADVLNYDEVGYLAAVPGEGVTGAHHTLPVPSYAEVTSLETGRTILVRLEQRGPMDSTHLLGLAPAAMAQLGATPETPVRLRRVNPPEDQRALLRAGGEATQRMDTPMSLVNVLRRNLPERQGPAALAEASTSPEPEAIEETVSPEMAATEAPAVPAIEPAADGDFESAFAETDDAQEEAAPLVSRAIEGRFEVQAIALSNRARAESIAAEIGGHVAEHGNLYRVRTGPFATRAQAEASLANVREAGYSDARIFTNG